MKAPTSELLSIIQLSKSNSFTIPKWTDGDISWDRDWAPQRITPWFYLPSYQRLPVEIQRRYNQLCSLAINEMFCLFEEEFLLSVLGTYLLKPGMDSELREALEIFCEEEIKHSEMFWQLSQKAAPQYYPQRDYFLIKKSQQKSAWFFNQVAKSPDFFVFWVWMAIFFEERTLMHSREYLMQARLQPDSLSPAFFEAHKLHLIEETRHVRLDEHMVDHFYRGSPKYIRTMTGIIMKQMIKNFASPQRSSVAIAAVLKQEFPQTSVAETLDRIMSELPSLATCKPYHQAKFGDHACTRTRKLMGQFPEFKGIWDVLSISRG